VTGKTVFCEYRADVAIELDRISSPTRGICDQDEGKN